MGRGKIEIKKIENKTNMQVTFSKRRNGIMKKAHELTVLCDATVSLIMVSATARLHHYLSPGASVKKIYDQYQKIMCVDIWSSHYEKMQKEERDHLEINNMLRREISRRMGGDLEDMSIQELCGLEQEMEKAVEVIRNQKFHKIKSQTGTGKKKVKNLKEVHGNLLMELESKFGGSQFGLADEDQGAYEAAAAYPILQHGAGYANVHDLRLA